LISTESDQFDPSYYENSSLSSLPNGSTLPVKLGFTKMGIVGNTSNTGAQISNLTGEGHIVELNFEDALNQDSGTDPVIYLNGSDATATYGNPARGVKYGDAGFGDYESSSISNTFKRFVKNYEFDNSYSFIDEDLEEMFDRYTSGVPNIIQISFVVYSTGIDYENFQEMNSVPVYLGTVDIQNFSDNSGDSPDES
ncbi:MAG: hypothetical protein PQJ50_06405, partial [Spirochaetales bacterium]|nr:hypothetical protein [Spirochaetales bacterium]